MLACNLAPSIKPRETWVESFPGPNAVERRSKIRFDLYLRVRYQTLGRGCLFAGVGHLVNMSSNGVSIACEHDIAPGTQMAIDGR